MRSIHGILFSLIILVVFAGTVPIAQAQAAVVRFDLPAQPLADSLRAVGGESNTNILFDPPLVAGHKAPALKAEVTVDQALTRLLVGTGIKHEFLNETTVVLTSGSAAADPRGSLVPGPDSKKDKDAGPQTNWTALSDAPVRLAQTNPAHSQDTQNTNSSESATKAPEKTGLEEIVVTGTNIHNIEPIAPMITITGQTMIEQGYSRLDQVIDQLPQNFKGNASQESNAILNAGSGAATNQYLASGVNLRGLGTGATLVLLNGRRLAPTANGASVDISSIPVSAIDRVEILTDGASAIYGSDAIAGVVNVITKKNYSGVETGVRSTGISHGKAADYGGNIMGGYDWGSGNFLVNFDSEEDNELLAHNRSFESAAAPNPLDLLPAQTRRSLYAALRQDVTGSISIASDLLVSDRTFLNSANSFGVGDVSGSAKQLTGSLELDFSISPDWNSKVTGQSSREKDANTQWPSFVTPTCCSTFFNYEYKASSVDAVIDGKLFELPGGALKVAIGGQAKYESLLQGDGYLGSPEQVSPVDKRSSQAAYGEIYVPIVGKQNAIPLVQQLDADIAARYDHYSDFGSTTNPKVGLHWVPIEGVALHAAYSKSFRAPLLFQLDALGQAGYIDAVNDPSSPNGSRTALLLDGSNPKLQPERANSLTAGLTFKPPAIPELKMDLSYFRINYTNKVDRLIQEGFYSNIITNANQLGSLVNLHPSLSQVNAALATVPPTNLDCYVSACAASDIGAIADIGYVNVGVASVRGYDLDARYQWDENFGRLYVDLAGSLLSTNTIQITPTSEPVSLLNNLFQPLRFRAKTNVGWSRQDWSAYGRANFANAYHNSQDPQCPALPGCAVSSWTTIDAGISYTLPNGYNRMKGLRIALDVGNVFNRAPPTINKRQFAIPLTYDPLNANPLLRTFAISVTKAW